MARGRPARAGERATHRVELRLTLDEYRAAKALAESNGYTLADCLRLGLVNLADESGFVAGNNSAGMRQQEGTGAVHAPLPPGSVE